LWDGGRYSSRIGGLGKVGQDSLGVHAKGGEFRVQVVDEVDESLLADVFGCDADGSRTWLRPDCYRSQRAACSRPAGLLNNCTATKRGSEAQGVTALT
jgi:hypothetical protein